jgi:hypothetical protein
VTSSGAPPYRVFVSHGSVDLWVAAQLAREIGVVGAETFLDDRDLRKGDDYRAILLREVKRADELVALFTPWSINRPWVWNEIGAAWGLDKRVIAILYGLSFEELVANAKGGSVLESRNVLHLNDAARYFYELQGRISRGGHGS